MCVRIGVLYLPCIIIEQLYDAQNLIACRIVVVLKILRELEIVISRMMRSSNILVGLSLEFTGKPPGVPSFPYRNDLII